MDEQMARLRSLWAGEPVGDEIGPVGPAPLRPGGPEVLVGGFAPAALARVGRFGNGLLCAAPPAWAAGLFAAVARSWVEHGRSGAPRNVGQVNVALADLGADEVVLYCWATDPTQLDRLADLTA